MDQSWKKESHISDEYANGVEQFLQFIERNAQSLGGQFFCPCVKCLNRRCHSINEIRSHLICYRIIWNYTKWIWQGELLVMLTVGRTKPIDEDVEDCIEDMIRNHGQDYFQQAHAPLYEKIENDSKKPLYSGCTAFTRLLVVLALVNLKA